MRPSIVIRVVLVAVLTAGGLLPTQPATAAGGQKLAAYRGLGAWVDIFDDKPWADPEGYVASLSAKGVRTLFLQTTTYRRRGPFRFPEKVGRFVDAAKARNMKIVAWYVPGFARMARDKRWSVAAIKYVSPGGNRFDSFALDIEVTKVKNNRLRAKRVVRLSNRIRRAAGKRYPLGAIVVSPIRAKSYWPIFPDARIAKIYDVVLPMAYSGHSRSGLVGTHHYIRDAIRLTRTRSKKPRVPIHIIGGIANQYGKAETIGFGRAVREHGLIGASLYDAETSGPINWRVMRNQIKPTPLQRPPMPLQIGRHTGAYGKIPGVDKTHRREVFFRTGGTSGAKSLRFGGFGIDKREVVLRVNWKKVKFLPKGRPNGWKSMRIRIPDRLLKNKGENLIAFHAQGVTDKWGVRRVRLV